MNTQHKYERIPDVPTSAVEIYRMLPEGTRCEVIFNELIMSPSPSSQHQFLLSDLHVLLYSFIRQKNTGKILLSPLDVYLEEYESAIQPDLMVVLNDKLDKIGKDGFYGTPDIVIEILSQNKAYDTRRKRTLYEKAGVKEYFIIDPENKQTILLTLNTSGVYEETYEAAGVLRSAILNCDLTF